MNHVYFLLLLQLVLLAEHPGWYLDWLLKNEAVDIWVLWQETQKLTVKSSMSLHIPLHRVLSAILSKLVLFSWTDNKEGFLSRLQVDYTEAEV
jgi:hypothetical protein